MSKVRFRADATNSFFGNFLYSCVLPQENFLVRMKDEIPWEKFTQGMLSVYKGGGEYGPTPYAPDKILCQVPNFSDSVSLSFFIRCHFEN